MYGRRTIQTKISKSISDRERRESEGEREMEIGKSVNKEAKHDNLYQSSHAIKSRQLSDLDFRIH